MGPLFLSKDCGISLSGRSWEGGAGSELYNQRHRFRQTQVPRGSRLRRPLGENTANLWPSHLAGPRRVWANPTPLLFKSKRPSNNGYIWLGDQSSTKSGKPSRGRKQKDRRGMVGTQAMGPQPWWEPQVPEMSNAPPYIQLGRAALALGRLPSYTCLLKRWHPSSNPAGVTCPPLLPDARQEQQTAVPGIPVALNHCVRGDCQGENSVGKEKSVFFKKMQYKQQE